VGTFVAGCAFALRRPGLVSMPMSRLPPLEDDLEVASLRIALEQTIPWWEAAGRRAAVAAALELVRTLETVPDPAARRRALARTFRALHVRDPLLLTSYYEPEIGLSEVADARYRFPLYRRPPDLTQPYFSRAEIDAGALRGRNLELAWTDDAFELFSLHVQGSGIARFPDGHSARIRFAGTNGLPYASLGRVLVQQGLLAKDDASLFAIRRLFATMTDADRQRWMAENPRYVFFTMTDGSKGPIGTMGVELTPMRSVATDPQVLPLGTIGYLVTPTIRRFVVSQDTGGAIRGAHADLFAGSGKPAEEFAGRQKERGALYVLVPL
jgi:membrane-bound lytic murein transglycosylase A